MGQPAMMAWLDRASFLCLCGFILVLPVTIAGVEFFASLACFFFLVRKVIASRRGVACGTLVPLSVLVPALAFLAVCAISILYSEAPQLSMRAFVGKSFLAVLLFLLVPSIVVTRKRLAGIFGCFFVSAVVLAGDGFWQLWQGYDFFNMRLLVGDRVGAAMRHPNDLGAYLIPAVSVALAFTLWAWTTKTVPLQLKHGHVKAMATLVFMMLCSTLGLTYSRSAWLGFFVALLAFILMRRQYMLVCITGVIFFGLIFLPLMVSARHISLVPRDAKAWRVLEDMTFNGSGRLTYWGNAVQIIKDHPFGTGLNTYTVVIKRYSQIWQAYPHNCYLQMASEIGISGVAVFLWLLWSVGRFFGRCHAGTKEDLTAVLLTGLFVGWIGLLVESGFDTTLYSVQLSKLLWFMMGILVSGVLILEKEKVSV